MAHIRVRAQRSFPAQRGSCYVPPSTNLGGSKFCQLSYTRSLHPLGRLRPGCARLLALMLASTASHWLIRMQHIDGGLPPRAVDFLPQIYHRIARTAGKTREYRRRKLLSRKDEPLYGYSHNPKVEGSNPSPATKHSSQVIIVQTRHNQ